MKYIKTYEGIFDFFKKDEIKLDILDEFINMDFKETVEYISSFLKKCHIEFEIKEYSNEINSFHIMNNESNELIVIEVKSTWLDKFVDGLYFSDKSNMSNSDRILDIKNLKGVIKMISKYIPEVVTNKLFNNINN